MSSRRSRADFTVDRFLFYACPSPGIEGFGGQDIDVDGEFRFQKVRHIHESIEGFPAIGELDEQVDIGIRPGIPSGCRTEYSDAADAQSPKSGGEVDESILYILL